MWYSEEETKVMNNLLKWAETSNIFSDQPTNPEPNATLKQEIERLRKENVKLSDESIVLRQLVLYLSKKLNQPKFDWAPPAKVTNSPNTNPSWLSTYVVGDNIYGFGHPKHHAAY